MKSTYVIISYINHYGGIETLVLRMLEWLYKNGHRTILVTDADRIVDEGILSEVKGYHTEVYYLPFRSACSAKEMKQVPLRKDEKVKIFTFTYPEYFLGQQIKHYYSDVCSDIIFYVPHQYGLIMEFNFTNRVLKYLAKKLGTHFAEKMCLNNEVVHMDGLCANRLEEEYNIDKNFAPIIPLAVEIEAVNKQRIENIFKSDNNILMTIARTEFPFKGYILGLIKLFDKLVEDYPSLELMIIGNGPDFDKMKHAQEESSHKDKIHLVGSVPYKELGCWFEQAKIYVGMGTTIIDAANNSVLAFPIGSYTYECRGYDYYYKDGMNLGGLYGENDIEGMVRQALGFNQKQYLNVIEKQFLEIKRCYDIDSVMAQIDNLRNKENISSVSKLEMFILKILKYGYSGIKRIKK